MLRAVVEELRSLVEERGVVLVAFDDELAAPAQAPGLPEVQRHAADQERRDRARRPCSTCASSDEVVVLPCVPATTTERACRRPAGTACRTATGTTPAGCCRSCAASTSTWSLRQTLPTTTASGAQSRFAGPKPSKHRDLLLRELRRHRRVDVLVGAAHVVAGRLEQARQRAHARAADPDEVDFIVGSLGHALRRAGAELRREPLHFHREVTLKSLEQPELAIAGAARGVPAQVRDHRRAARLDAPALARPWPRRSRRRPRRGCSGRPARRSAPTGRRTTRAPSARTRRYRARGATPPPLLAARAAVKVTSCVVPGKHVDVEAGLAGVARRSVPASANRAWRLRRSAPRRISKRLCRVVGRRVSAASPASAAGAGSAGPPLQRAPARLASRAARLRSAHRIRRRPAEPPTLTVRRPPRRRPGSSHAATTRATPHGSAESNERRHETRCDGGGRRHLAYVP